jgi:hypothetical protein
LRSAVWSAADATAVLCCAGHGDEFDHQLWLTVEFRAQRTKRRIEPAELSSAALGVGLSQEISQ